MDHNNVLNLTQDEAPVRSRKVRLLCADDNPAVLRQVCAMLKDEFDIAAAVTSGEAVVGQYANLNPDAIILDLSMPRMSGLHVAKVLRERGCRLPIVFLTVHTGTDCVSAALACGGLGYVVKSHMRSDLIPAIRAAMSGRLFVSPHAS